MYCYSDQPVDSVVIKHIIMQHQARVIASNDDEDIQSVRVRRCNILSDSLRQFSRKSFDVSRMIKVNFIGEEAVDLGGPRREFFHLLMREFFQSQYFAGYPDHVIPLHNVEAVVDNKFYTFGKMIATCIVQGGEVPVCFAKPVADYMVNREVSSPTNLDDIPDYDVKDCLTQVHSLFERAN